ncbi:hypothetical protein [Promicromonospora soli]
MRSRDDNGATTRRSALLRRIRGTVGLTAGLALTATLFTAAPASAWTRIVGDCDGDKVDRCLSIRKNSTGTVYARVSVSDDQSDSSNYDVFASGVCLDYYAGGEWIRKGCSAANHEYDPIESVDATNAYRIPCGYRVRAVGWTMWAPANDPSSPGGSQEMWVSGTASC